MERLLIHNISKSYSKGSKVLDGVSLSLGNGMFGLLGPNGAGKSSLMRTLATLQMADQGSFHFDNVDIFENPQSLRNQLGYLPQDFGVYPKISAYELLNHFALLKGIENGKDRKEQIDFLLNQTNLFHERHRAVSNYSGGMKQRFGVAQALLGNPQLIIVDEPTAGLDPYERNKFHDLLNEIGESRVVILSTHIVEDVKDLCSEIAILFHGKIILQGQPNELVKSIEQRIWRKLLTKDELLGYSKGYQIIFTRVLRGKVLAFVLADNCPENGFELVQPTVEDLYFVSLFENTTLENGGMK